MTSTDPSDGSGRGPGTGRRPGVGDPIAPAAAIGFDRGAAVDERARPSYPAPAVAWLVERGVAGPGTHVVDLAAGTGKLTRLLVGTGATVTAVEPVAGMRAELARVLPDVDVRDGTAEALPLGDASVDAINPATAGRDRFVFPHTTWVTVATRR